MIPIESTRNFLVGRGVREQVTCQLPDGELVKTQILIKGFHHPVTPDPLPGIPILLTSIAIGITGGIEPRECHSFAVVLAGQ